MHVVVLGSGIVGTTTAWYLRAAGHDVTVVERQSEAGRETSYANGGQVSVGHVEPWASLATLPSLLPWLCREDAPLLFRLRADPAQWRWALAFLRQCLPGRSASNWRQLLQLGLYSRQALTALRETTGIAYHSRTTGILNLYDTASAWARGQRAAAQVTRLGYDRHPVSWAEALAIEPALTHSQLHWAGGTFTPADESGDAHQFTLQLAQRSAAAGVSFLYNHSAESLVISGGQVCAVQLRPVTAAPAGTATTTAALPVADLRAAVPLELAADAVVVALGSYGNALLRPLGMRIPVYPVKGYSATVAIRTAQAAPSVSITDDAAKMVFTRLGDQLRIAGTAEFDGFNLALNPTRCAALIRRAQALFPEAADYANPVYWTGLRPATPSGVPLIGPTRIPNLYLNTGHGTLGWTLGCGSSRLLAEMLCGEKPGGLVSLSVP